MLGWVAIEVLVVPEGATVSADPMVNVSPAADFGWCDGRDRIIFWRQYEM